MDAHEIIPHLTLGAVVPDDWTIGDMDEIGENGSDNTIVTITRYGLVSERPGFKCVSALQDG